MPFRVQLILGPSFAPDCFSESEPEVPRRAVVDDRIDAGVEVGKAVPSHGNNLVDSVLRYFAEKCNEKMHVNGKPKQGKQDDDEDEQSADLLLPSYGFHATQSRNGWAIFRHSDGDTNGKEPDNGQREHVSESEKSGEQILAGTLVVEVTIRDEVTVLLLAVDEQHRYVEQTHDDPSPADERHGDRPGTEPGRADVVNDGQIAHDGDQDQRVDGHVSGHVDQVVHELADGIAEGPPLGRQLVGCERRDDQYEREIGYGEVEQQQVDHSAHALLGDDDVDD